MPMVANKKQSRLTSSSWYTWGGPLASTTSHRTPSRPWNLVENAAKKQGIAQSEARLRTTSTQGTAAVSCTPTTLVRCVVWRAWLGLCPRILRRGPAWRGMAELGVPLLPCYHAAKRELFAPNRPCLCRKSRGATFFSAEGGSALERCIYRVSELCLPYALRLKSNGDVGHEVLCSRRFSAVAIIVLIPPPPPPASAPACDHSGMRLSCLDG